MPTTTQSKIGEADGLQGLFELSVYWAIFWAFPAGLAFGMAGLLDAAFPTGRGGVHALVAILAGLALGIGMSFGSDTRRGGRIGATVARYVHDYAFSLALVAGFVAGWWFRSDYVPDIDRANAEQAAWRACGKMPECVERATMGNWGNPVDFYISPPTAPTGP
jgi:hypothetical protein